MKKLKAFKYLIIYLVPTVFLISILSKSNWSFFALFFVFGAIPLVELFTTGTEENFSPEEEKEENKNKIYDYIIWGLVPFQYVIVYYFLVNIGDPTISLLTKVGMTSALGLSCSILGINIAHELGHRNTKHEQFMSKALLLTSLYLHFFIEHNKGHHKNVSTDDDPASSRYGETLYAFYFRSVWTGWLSAWKIETNRLEVKQQSFWSIHNQMIRYQIVQFSFLLIIFLQFGLETMLYFIVAATIGFLLLESVNYIEHYGLRRKPKGNSYERTLPIHSWNSNHTIGRFLLMELSRHSDHHYMASRKYQILRHFDESPQMPTGYPGMVLLAFFPPLWFKVMNKKVAEYKSRLAGSELA